MKQRVLSLILALLGIAAGAQAQSANSVYVGSQLLSDGTYYINDLPELIEGNITYDSDQKLLTLDKAVIKNTSGNGIQITVPDLTIKLIGQCIINATNYGLDLYGDVTIEGNGRKNLDGLTITNTNSSGIHFNTGGCTLTITNSADVSAEGEWYGIYGDDSNPCKLVMTGKYTQLGLKGGIACIKYMDLEELLQSGCAIDSPAGAKYKSSIKTVVDADGNEVRDQCLIFQTGVAINEMTFPDEIFRDWILNQHYGEDGVLTYLEIDDVTDIQVAGVGISSLLGIEFFTSLEWLDCYENKLTELDVSNNKKLETLNCFNNQLYVLDVSNNKKLEILNCGSNQLTELDVSNNTSLTYFNCSWNGLTSLDVSNNTALEILYCSMNQLTALNVWQNTALTELDCTYNQLSELDVSQNTALKTLNCSGNQLTALDVSNNTALAELYCQINMLTELDLSKNTALKWLDCSNNQLAVLDVSKNKELNNIYCYQNAICGKKMTAFVKSLPTISDGNGTLIVYDNEAPTGNKIDALQVKIATDKNWRVVDWYGNNYEGKPVPAIDEENFPDENFRNYVLRYYSGDGYLTDDETEDVKVMLIQDMNIANLKGIEFFTSLEYLYCDNNQLTSLDLSKNTALTYLQCYNNRLTALEVSGCTELTYLRCDNNQLTALDVSNNTALKNLRCDNNQLTALDVSNNTALTYLDCNKNQLTALDVSNNTALTWLDCSTNLLTALDVSNNQELQMIACYVNAICGKEMAAFVKSLPDVSETRGTLIVYTDKASEGYEERNEMTSAQVAAAKDKGWSVIILMWNEDGYYDWVDYEGVKVKGDLNNDDKVNIADVIILSNAIQAGSTDLNFDVNGDEKVDAEDITAIVNIIIGNR